MLPSAYKPSNAAAKSSTIAYLFSVCISVFSPVAQSNNFCNTVAIVIPVPIEIDPIVQSTLHNTNIGGRGSGGTGLAVACIIVDTVPRVNASYLIGTEYCRLIDEMDVAALVFM